MPQLIKSLIEVSVDYLAGSVLNKENRTDILYTMPGINAHSTNPEDIAYSIDYFYKNLDKKVIFLSDYKEAPNPDFLTSIKNTIDILTQKYQYDYSQLVYVSGFVPTIENFKKLNKTYLDFGMPPIKNLNVFYFEEEWKRVMNTCEFYPNNLNLAPLYSRNLRSKKMLFFMSAARPHRIAMLSFLIKENYIKDCYYSCLSDKNVVLLASKGCSVDDQGDKRFDFKDITSIISESNDVIPKELSCRMGENHKQHEFSEQDLYYFSDSYYSIIGETSYFKKPDESKLDPWNFHLDYTFITEKTMRSIGALHPFVLMSRPYSLKGLREMGYQTFHPYIDESYDTIEDDYLRFEKMKESIRKLNSKTDSEWIKFQHDIYPIVKHNHDWLRADKVRKLAMSFSAI